MGFREGEWPPHPNEAQRLKLLHSFDVLDTEFERAFDHITELLKLSFAAPICLVTLLDVDRQWFKSCIGLDVCETSRDRSFCAHAILPQAPEIFIVKDASEDERFADNPLVTGAPFIRFYASAPLVYLGEKLGCLCVMDTKPRPDGISEDEATTLTLLASMVVDQLVSRLASKRVEEAHLELFQRTAELNATNQELTGLIDSANAPIFAVDSDLVVTVWNRKIAELTSVKGMDVLGKPFGMVLDICKPVKEANDVDAMCYSRDSSRRLSGMISAFATELSNEIDSGEPSSGREAVYETLLSALQVSAEPKLGSQGEIVGVVCVGEDVLAQKRVMREQLLNHHLQETNAAKDAFLASMSHEMRTPLNGLLGMLQLALATNDSSATYRFIKQAQNSGKLLLNLLNDIFDIARIEAKQLRLDEGSFELMSTLEEAIAMVTAKAAEKQLELELDVDEVLQGKTFVGDCKRIQQVLLNLLWNSLKFTAEGFVKLNVKMLSDGQSSVQVLFEVVDSGIGIPLEDQENIFQRYTQASKRRHHDGVTMDTSGSGLGMCICKELVDLMGGHISLTSLPVIQGTAVSVVLPLMMCADTEISFSDGPGAPIEDESGARSLNILVVEDNDYNVDVCKEILEFLGHRVSIACNGEEGFQSVCQFWSTLDLVLMDCDMPVMNGFDATRAIRNWEAETGKQEGIRIIAVTAHALSGDKQRCFDSGMDDYLAKPILLPELREKLKMHTRRHRDVSSRSSKDSLRPGPIITTATLLAVPQSSPQDNPLVACLKHRKISDSDAKPALRHSLSCELNGTKQRAKSGEVDLKTLEDNFAGNLKLVAQTLKTFNGKLVLERMRTLWDSRDIIGLEKLAHKAKGQLRYISAMAAYEVATRFEHACKKVLDAEPGWVVEGQFAFLADDFILPTGEKASEMTNSIGALFELLCFEVRCVLGRISELLCEIHERLQPNQKVTCS